MGQNQLHLETSPYLLQHKDNAVHWQPWGEDALTQAKNEGKPILLSVGYAACHWCHVMAHESFESNEIAALMNELFVSIKVDREERPDLDMIYQAALAMLGEQGGWPLTMFLTPDGEPFWGGTYFPPEPRFGRPSFPEVLQSVSSTYERDPDRIAKNVEALRDGLKRLSASQVGNLIPREAMDSVAARLVREIDPFHGGIGSAPKFPQTMFLEQLWRAWKRSRQDPFFRAVDISLSNMCQGGIYDHVGGGFSRYAVDDRWLVPHFEKMLYDNALLIDLLTLVWQETANPLYGTRVSETVDWILRDMVMEDDGFASSLDADSEGEEGKFYVWSVAEIDALLGDRAALFKSIYDVTPTGNWEGKVILNRSQSLQPADGATEIALKECRETLLEVRNKRVAPGKDDKVLADWNGLMIAAIANAAAVFNRPNWLDVAKRAFAFVEKNMVENGRLMHSWRDGRLKHPATLDDYANMGRAALVLFEVTGETGYLERAETWLETIELHYADPDSRGYFFSADDTPHLIARAKVAADNATPSGNGTLAGVFARLYYLTGKDMYRKRGEAVVSAFSGGDEANLLSMSALVNNAEFLSDALQIVVVGSRREQPTQAMVSATYSVSLPNKILQVIGPEAALPDHHPAHNKGQISGIATTYVCRGQVCSAPFTDPDALAADLEAR